MLPHRLIFLLTLFLCTSAPAAFGYMVPVALGWPSKGPPGTYVEPPPIAEVLPPKFQDRVPTAPIIPKPVPVETIRKAAVHEAAERTSLPWSCDTIRAAVSKLTKEQRERLGRIYRLSKQQMAEARRCLEKQT